MENFVLKFSMRNCFKILSIEPRLTGLLISWLLRLISILLRIPTAIKWDYNKADNWYSAGIVVSVFISSQNKRRKLTAHNVLKLKSHTSTAWPRSMNKVTTTWIKLSVSIKGTRGRVYTCEVFWKLEKVFSSKAGIGNLPLCPLIFSWFQMFLWITKYGTVCFELNERHNNNFLTNSYDSKHSLTWTHRDLSPMVTSRDRQR